MHACMHAYIIHTHTYTHTCCAGLMDMRRRRAMLLRAAVTTLSRNSRPPPCRACCAFHSTSASAWNRSASRPSSSSLASAAFRSSSLSLYSPACPKNTDTCTCGHAEHTADAREQESPWCACTQTHRISAPRALGGGVGAAWGRGRRGPVDAASALHPTSTLPQTWPRPRCRFSPVSPGSWV